MSDYSDEDDYFDPSDYDSESEDFDDDEAQVENEYYSSKDLMEDDVDEAIEGFRKVIELEKGTEEGKGEWGFRSCKRIIKLLCNKGEYQATIPVYEEMLTYIKLVTRNKAEKATGRLLDFVAATNQMDILMQFYKITLDVLGDLKMDRLWFNTKLKQAKLCFQLGEYRQQAEILKDLVESCKLENGEDDPKKGTQLTEIYALQIQMYTETKDNKKLKDLYEKCQQIQSAINHPATLGVISECGGKMHMREQNWNDAKTDFFEAFKSYTDCGHSRRFNCLRYLVLANMLMDAEVDPFDAQETKPYKNDAQIVSMVALVNAYQNNQISDFERILQDNQKDIMEDNFIADYIEDLLNNLRKNVLLKLIKPYKTIRLAYIADALNIPVDQVESLCVSLILDGQLNALIDQVNNLLQVKSQQSQNEMYSSVDQWAQALLSLQTGVHGRLG